MSFQRHHLPKHFHFLDSLSCSTTACKNGQVSSTCKDDEQTLPSPFTKDIYLWYYSKNLAEELMAREQGMTHHHQRGNPVEMTCCLLRSVQTFHLQSRKRDCIQQMLNMNKAKKNSRVSFKTNDKSGNKLSFFFFFFHAASAIHSSRGGSGLWLR